MSKKIALVGMCVLADSTSGPHFRYTAWRTTTPVERPNSLLGNIVNIHTEIVLRFEGKTIEEILATVPLKATMSDVQVNRGSVVLGEDGSVLLPMSVEVSAQSDLKAHYLGEHDGYDCYAIYRVMTTPKQKHYFGIAELPPYGRADGILRYDHARMMISKHNPANVKLTTGQELDYTGQLRLIDYIQEKVAPILQPFVERLVVA